MKKKLLSILFCCLVVAGVYAQNLVSNGGFETWTVTDPLTNMPTSWDRGSGAVGTNYLYATDASQGNVLRLVEPTSGSVSARRFYTTSNFSILTEGTYRVTFKLKGNVGLRWVSLVKGSAAPDLAGSPNTNFLTNITTYPSGTSVSSWTTVQYDITVPSNATFGTDYRLHFSWSSSLTSNKPVCDFQIDDISLVKNYGQLSIPTISSASNFTSDGFNANWSTVANAVSYDVKLYEDGVLKSTTNVVGQASSSLTLTGLLAGKDYTYTVTAIANGTSYSNSAASSASTACTTTTPGLLSPFDIRPTGFTAYWKPTPNATGYTINLYQGGDLISTIAASGQTATSAVITGLNPGLSYTYTVTGSDGFTSVSSSAITTLTPVVLENFADWTDQATYGSYSITKKLYDGVTDGTFTSNYLQVLPTQALTSAGTATGNGRPSAGRLIMGGTTSYLNLPLLSGISTIILKNHAGTTGNRYKLQSSTNNVDWVDVAGTEITLKSTVAEATTHNINTNNSIYVRINPMQAGANSYWDLQINPYISSTKLTTPTITSASGISSTEFMANWEAVANALGYYIKVYQNGSYLSTIYADGQSSTNAQITGLLPNTNYTYKVIARGNVSMYSSSDASVASTSFATSNIFNVSGNTSISALTSKNTSSVINVPTGATLTIDANTEVSSITAAPGAKVTLADTKTLSGALTLQSDETGTATFVDNKTVSPQAITGTVQQRFVMTTARNWYMSTPIALASVPTGQTYYSYVEAGNNNDLSALGTLYWKPEAAGNPINPAKGYIAPISSTSTMEFNGTFNTGQYTVALTRTPGKLKEGFNLVANPYPSYLDWSLVDTIGAKIMSSVWYRTKTSGNAYTFDTYNGGLNVATSNGANFVSNLIPPMQAFWVRVKSPETAGTLTFTNAMRKHIDNTSNKFKVAGNNTTDTKLVRLKVSNATNSDETILCFNSNVSDNYDSFDSPKMFNITSEIPEIYTVAGTEKLVINGMRELKTNTEIPLGFVAGESNDFTIEATEFKNLDTDIRLILKDKQKNVEFELTENVAYHFNSDVVSASTNRFSIIFRATGVTTGVENTSKLNTQVFVNAANQITIIAPEKSKYAIYNAVGQLIENGISKSDLQTVNCKLQTGIYVVKVNNESTRVVAP